jgi:hypothetical protein
MFCFFRGIVKCALGKIVRKRKLIELKKLMFNVHPVIVTRLRNLEH